MTAAVEIYTRPGCGYCSAAKSLLTRKKAMYDRAGEGSTFPQIWIGGTHIGGCDDLYALDREGKLDGMLESVKAVS
jgi:glutaredoxin 3